MFEATLWHLLPLALIRRPATSSRQPLHPVRSFLPSPTLSSSRSPHVFPVFPLLITGFFSDVMTALGRIAKKCPGSLARNEPIIPRALAPERVDDRVHPQPHQERLLRPPLAPRHRAEHADARTIRILDRNHEPLALLQRRIVQHPQPALRNVVQRNRDGPPEVHLLLLADAKPRRVLHPRRAPPLAGLDRHAGGADRLQFRANLLQVVRRQGHHLLDRWRWMGGLSVLKQATSARIRSDIYFPSALGRRRNSSAPPSPPACRGTPPTGTPWTRPAPAPPAAM